MIHFVKWALRELKHVVWPTTKETQKYFNIVLIMLVIFGLYLFLFSNIFSTIIFGLKDMIWGETAPQPQTIEEINRMLGNEDEIPLISDEAAIEISIDDEQWETLEETDQ